MTQIKIPQYAKKKAAEALRLRKKLPISKRFGITKEKAKVLGISSGVERARQIIKEDKLSEKDAKKVARFYSRFKNCFTPKCEGAINLWGGRTWGKVLYQKYYEN